MSDFQKIYDEYAPSVYRFLLQLTANEGHAEELLQETFYRALQHIDRFEGRCSLYTWLCQIGKNAWFKERKRNARFSETEYIDRIPEYKDPEGIVIEREEYLRIHNAIRSLPDVYRDVFIMHVLGGIKLKEIATLYGKSESWARVTYYRGKQLIIEEVSK